MADPGSIHYVFGGMAPTSVRLVERFIEQRGFYAISRVLNLLQSTAMANEIVNAKSVYLTSGAPLPDDMKTILDLLFNHDFRTAYENISRMCAIKGYALADVLQDLTIMVVAMELPDGALAEILDGMSAVEHRLAFGTDEKLQTASLVGVYVKARQMMKAL